MKLSKKGAAFILGYEALVLSTYRDGGGVLTIGGGHTAAAGAPIPKLGMKLSLHEAIRIFKQDILKFETQVLRAVKVPLKQNEFDALVSFAYNTGAISSGSVDDKLNSGRVTEAMKTLELYRKDDGKVIPGLVERRKDERRMFEKNEYDLRTMFVYETYPGEGKSLRFDDLPWDDEDIAALPREKTKKTESDKLPPWAWLIFAILTAVATYFGINLELPQ